MFAVFQPLFQILRLYTVLQQLRDQRFHLLNGALLFHGSGQNGQLLRAIRCDLLQHKGLPEILQHRTLVATGLLEHAPREPSEGKNVYVQQPVPRMHCDKILLRLHRELLWDKDKIILFRMIDRFPDDFLINLIGFSGAAAADNEFQCHSSPPLILPS